MSDATAAVLRSLERMGAAFREMGERGGARLTPVHCREMADFCQRAHDLLAPCGGVVPPETHAPDLVPAPATALGTVLAAFRRNGGAL